MVKSAEEVDWLRIGAHMSDRAIMAVRAGLRPGLSERQLADMIEHAYVADGGGTTRIPEDPLRAGMAVVIHPNVVTPDGQAGVQTGEMVLVTTAPCVP